MGTYRHFRTGLKTVGQDVSVDFGPGVAQAVPGVLLPGDIPIHTAGATDGQVLAYDAGSGLYLPKTLIGGIANDLASSFDFAGGAHDYLADAAFDPAGFVAAAGSSALKSSGLLGDGVHVPHFYAFWRAGTGAIATLARTAGGALRLQPSNDLGNVDAYPFAFTGCSVAIPLPETRSMQIDFTLASTVGVQTGGNAGRAFCAVGGTYSLSGLFADCSAGWHWNGTAVEDEIQGSVNTATRSGATLGTTDNAFKSGSLFTRRFRFVLEGPHVEIYGAPTSDPTGTPTVALRQEWDTSSRVQELRRYFVLGINGTNCVSLSMYAELSALDVDGVRANL